MPCSVRRGHVSSLSPRVLVPDGNIPGRVAGDKRRTTGLALIPEMRAGSLPARVPCTEQPNAGRDWAVTEVRLSRWLGRGAGIGSCRPVLPGTRWDAVGRGWVGLSRLVLEYSRTAVARTRRSSSCNSVHVPRVNYHCGAGCARARLCGTSLSMGYLRPYGTVEPTERGWASSRKRLTPARTAALATCCSNGRSIPLLFRRKKQRQIEGPCRSSATSKSQMALSILNGVCTHSTSTAPVRKKSGINRINHRHVTGSPVRENASGARTGQWPQRAQTCDAASRG